MNNLEFLEWLEAQAHQAMNDSKVDPHVTLPMRHWRRLDEMAYGERFAGVVASDALHSNTPGIVLRIAQIARYQVSKAVLHRLKS